MSYREVSEVRDGMQIDWDMPIRWTTGWCCDATYSGRSRRAAIRSF